jgi:hypothetical protein
MKEEHAVPAPPAASGAQPQPEPDAGHIPITEELDSARWTMPPLAPLLIALGIVGVLVAGFVFGARPRAGGEGSIMRVEAVELTGGQNVLVLVQVRLTNLADKPLWVQNVKVKLEAPGAQWEDEPSAASEHDRYLAAFPQLEPYRIAPLRTEDRIASGATQEGMIIVGFPVPKATFDQRAALEVVVQPYDRTALVLRETR